MTIPITLGLTQPGAGQEIILQIRNISKSFPGVQALSDVSFDVMRGSVHAIMGENGAGKSTLMQILAGAQPPNTGGELVFEGKPVQFQTPKQASDAGIAIVYQELNLAPNLSVAENIFLGIEKRTALGLLDRADLHRRTLEVLKHLNIEIDPARIVGELLVAQQQLIEICKSLVRHPKLLILDEPTASLSEAESAVLFRIIAELKAQGVTMLYISHRLPEVFALGDYVTVLRDGKHVSTQPLSETNQDEVVRLMVGRELLAAQRSHVDHETAEVVLEVRDFSREGEYENVSFSVRRGEILGFSGLVGAGRSEVALGIFGAPAPDQGTLRLNGRTLQVTCPQDAIQAGIGLVPEDRKSMGLVLGLSVGSNTVLAALDKVSRSGFVNSGAEQQLVKEYIERFKVRTPNLAQLVGNLSGGNQQKVLLAKWLAIRPKVLIIDEPTRGVDVGTKAELYALLDGLARDGLAIVVISSDLPEILAVSDRILVMREGRIVGELSRQEATEERIMALSALGQVVKEVV